MVGNIRANALGLFQFTDGVWVARKKIKLHGSIQQVNKLVDGRQMNKELVKEKNGMLLQLGPIQEDNIKQEIEIGFETWEVMQKFLKNHQDLFKEPSKVPQKKVITTLI